jgi:hypothetical protein
VIRDMPAPPDLAALIDDYEAAMQGDDWRARCTTWRALIGWRGWQGRRGYLPGTVYFHRDMAFFKALGSVKPMPWPRVAKPERIAR